MSKSDSMTDEELLEAIKKSWYEISCFEYDASQEHEEFTVADEYMLSDQEQWLDRLEKAYKARGLTLPNRWEFTSQFESDDEEKEE